MEQKVLNSSGKQIGTVELNDEIFAAKPNPGVVHDVVVWQLAKRRSGTHATLTRTLMKGGGKKPFKQKGTGNARAGSIISPLWVGGAVTFGPQPRDYEKRMPKRTKRQALCSVLSQKAGSEKLIVLDQLGVADGKTKSAIAQLKSLGVSGKKALVLVEGAQSKAEAKANPLERAFRNIQRVKVLPLNGVNVYDVLNADFVLTSKETVKALEGKLLGENA